MAQKPASSTFTTVLLVILVLAGMYVFFGPSTTSAGKEVPFSRVSQEYKAGNVAKIRREAGSLQVTLKDGTALRANVEAGTSAKDLGFEDLSNIEYEVANSERGQLWALVLANGLPILLIVGFLMFMMRQAQSSNNNAMSFGKSKARLYNKELTRVTFKDVAGAPEAKAELVEVVDFLKNPRKYEAIGAKIPRGVMLFGPPGTGKTLLAKAVAGEANVPFFNISGSEFVEMFVGVGASRVRDLFQRAKRSAPCIIFIDEIDAVGRSRGAGMGGGHDEREQTLNQILVEMDGFDTNTTVIVIAATNRPDVLDQALLRPGRFDRRIIIDRPDVSDREQILKVHARGKPFAKDVNLARIAKITSGFSGANLENLLNESAIAAASRNSKSIVMKDIESAIEKVIMGPERKSRVLSKEELQITAYHEAGHAIVAKVLPNTHPVHKITIISRGMSLGATWYLPEEDKHLQSKAFFRDDLAVALGGRVAEALVYGGDRVTTGASNDIEKATQIARRMVTEFGMNDAVGPVAFKEEEQSFLGRGVGHARTFSEDTAQRIDVEVTALMKDAQDRATAVLTEHRPFLEKIAQVLIEKESVTGEEFASLFDEYKGVAPKARRTKKIPDAA